MGEINAVEVVLYFSLCELRDGGGVRSSGDCGGDGVNVHCEGSSFQRFDADVGGDFDVSGGLGGVGVNEADFQVRVVLVNFAIGIKKGGEVKGGHWIGQVGWGEGADTRGEIQAEGCVGFNFNAVGDAVSRGEDPGVFLRRPALDRRACLFGGALRWWSDLRRSW